MPLRETITTLLQDGFILVFNQDKLDVVKTAQSLLEAGVRNMEVTCRIRKPLEKIERLKRELPDFIAGCASLLDYPAMLNRYNASHQDDPLPTVSQAVDTGADYIVSAVNFRPETYQQFSGKVGIIPGCGSTNEIVEQFSLGANLCKLFPAKQLGGPGFVKAVDPAIHKQISIVPTGGTNPDNMPQYIDAGVLVLGGSFSLIDKDTLKMIVDEQNYDLLTRRLKKAKMLIDDCRTAKWPDIDMRSAGIKNISKTTGRDFNL
ncbi:MAG: hypothetical protein JXA82_04540 [Sedimentisphaerales bacterium]|nr:hypothetical protein [Sedimentisphaerales bacterium]